MSKFKRRTGSSGFTLIELLVVVLIIGILAAIAVPQYFKVVEKGRVAHALNCAGVLTSAQARYHLKNAAYATAVGNLDVGCPGLAHFTITSVGASNVLTRTAATATYGQYTVTATSDGGALACNNTSCTADLMP